MNRQQSGNNNVISLFSRTPESKNEADEALDAQIVEKFDDAMKRNQQNRDRLREARAKANQAVLASYRIKN